MRMADSQTPAFAAGDANFAECKMVHDFIGTSVRPVVERALDKTNPAHATYFGALLRVHAWLRSLGKLNHPGDFQAAVSGSRALFEILVDLTLLHHDPKSYSHEKIVAWERSASLKYAEGIKRFYDEGNKPVPDDHREAVAFLAQETAAIHALRRTHWPRKDGKASHPDRWTGQPLADDAERADQLAPQGLREFYAARFMPICWSTHGSGLAGVRKLREENFPAVIALGFGESARFAAASAELVVRLFGQYDGIAEARFKALERDRLTARAKVLAQYPPLIWNNWPQ